MWTIMVNLIFAVFEPYFLEVVTFQKSFRNQLQNVDNHGGVLVAVFIISHNLHKMYHLTIAFKKMKPSSTKMQLTLLEMPLAKFKRFA